MKVHNVVQGSDEWKALRKGRMTASHAQAIGANGKGLATYITDLMAECYSLTPEEGYTNEDMERGIAFEDIARSAYELTTGNTVDQVGFIEVDEFVGCSPDGLVGKEGGFEAKCLNNRNHFALVMGGDIDTKHEWQCQMNLYITKRKWWDYVAYNQNFSHSLVIRRVFPDKKKFEKLAAGIEIGKNLIKEIRQKYD